MNTNMNIYFDKTCKKLKIIPNKINKHTKSTSVAAKKLWLHFEIKFVELLCLG